MKQNRGWPINIEFLRSPPEVFSSSVLVFGFAVFLVLTLIAISALGWVLSDLMSGDQHRGAEAAKTSLPIIAAAIGLPLLIWRLLILSRQTRISDEKTQIDRETHYTSIFSRSIEQLGQTREIKGRSNTVNGTIETTSTVPNIEVRLGGIHSLARLAEESIRDKRLVENILRSYVRENSWSDKNNQTAAKLVWDSRIENAHEWSREYRKEKIKEESISEYNKWKESAEQQRAKCTSWGATLPETRVDVNEAVDAVQAILRSGHADRPILYECLFVDRKFSTELLSRIKFKRCSFVRCSFDGVGLSEFIANDCQFVECDFSGKSMQIEIADCSFSSTDFTNVEDSNIVLRDSVGLGISFYSSPKRLIMTSCIFHEFFIMGDDEIEDQEKRILTDLSLADSVFSEAYFGFLKLTSTSNFNFESCVGSQLGTIDLSDLQEFDAKTLNHLEARVTTLGPATVARPKKWPAYDPKKDDF